MFKQLNYFKYLRLLLKDLSKCLSTFLKQDFSKSEGVLKPRIGHIFLWMGVIHAPPKWRKMFIKIGHISFEKSYFKNWLLLQTTVDVTLRKEKPLSR